MRALKNPWVKILLIIAVLLVLFLGSRFLNIDLSKVSEEEFKHWVETLGGWGPVIYVLVYVLRPLILFPAGVLSASAGVIWGPLVGFLYLQIAANISSTVEFLFARYLGRAVVEKHLKGKMHDLDEKIEKHGFLTVLLIRLIPNLPWDVQNLSLGLTKVSFKDYFIATLIGIMPGSFAFVFFGSSLIKALFDPRNLWMVAVGILIFIVLYKLQSKIRSATSKSNQ